MASVIFVYHCVFIITVLSHVCQYCTIQDTGTAEESLTTSLVWLSYLYFVYIHCLKTEKSTYLKISYRVVNMSIFNTNTS